MQHRKELEVLLHQVIASHEPELLPLVAQARPMRLTDGEAEKLVAIISSGFYSSKHIFVLTGYDTKTKTFFANDTFENRNGIPKNITTMGGKALTAGNIIAHARAQSSDCYFILSPVTQDAPNF